MSFFLSFCLLNRELFVLNIYLSICCISGQFNVSMEHVMRKPVLAYANNKGADQPAHPRSLTSAFVVRCLDSMIHLLAIAEISRL